MQCIWPDRAGQDQRYQRHLNEGAIQRLCVDQFIEMLQFHFVRSVMRSAKPKILICHLQNSWIDAKKSGQAEQDPYNGKSGGPMFSIGLFFRFSTFYPWTRTVLVSPWRGRSGHPSRRHRRNVVHVRANILLRFMLFVFFLFFVTNRKGLGCLAGFRSVGLARRPRGWMGLCARATLLLAMALKILSN